MSLPPPFRTFSYHYRQKYGHPVGKIPLDMGLPCPNRKRGGCIFCRPAGFSPAYLDKREDVAQQIEQGKKHLLKNRFTFYFAYFQQETSTAIASELLMPALLSVLEDNNCHGIILSTRPDFVEEGFLRQLSDGVRLRSKECLVELGVQTIHDSSLHVLNRNHTFAHSLAAVERIKAAGNLEVGVHLLFGIPGELEKDMLETVDTVARVGVHSVKFHHLQVLKDTALYRMYREGRFQPYRLEDYLRLLLKVLPRLPENVVIHRLWATAHPELLVAPRWNVLATRLSQALRQTMEKLNIRQGDSNSVARVNDSVINAILAAEMEKIYVSESYGDHRA